MHRSAIKLPGQRFGSHALQPPPLTRKPGTRLRARNSLPTQRAPWKAHPDHSARSLRGLRISASFLTPLSKNEESPSILRVPLFTSNACLLPAGTGTLHLYEPRYLNAFSPLRSRFDSLPSSSSSSSSSAAHSVLFGHILREAPPGLVGEGLEKYALPQIGVAANVTGFSEVKGEDNAPILQVHYEGYRRFKILQVEETEGVFQAVVELFSDEAEPEGGADAQASLKQLEFEVWEALVNIQRLLIELHGSDGAAAGSSPADDFMASLPRPVVRYRPPPPSKQQPIDRIVQRLTDQNRPAGRDISMWRLGSEQATRNGGSSPSSSSRVEAGDPYAAAAGNLNNFEGRRQEMFSFACAQMVDVGIVERLILNQSTTTASRFQWVKGCIEPYLNQLVAEKSIKSALSQSS